MTDFRALCAELHTAFNTYAVDESHHDLLVRVDAALAQPEPEPEVDDILRLAAIIREVNGGKKLGAAALAEAILSHRDSCWGRSAQPEPQGSGPTNQELVNVWEDCKHAEPDPSFPKPLIFAHAVLARWGCPAKPEVQGPTEAQLKTFACEWWHSFGFAKDKATCTWVIDHVAPEHFADFSRDVLARWSRPTIEPVPVAERLPEPKDCDAEGRCWFGTPGSHVMAANWVYRKMGDCRSWDTHWLPHHTLPVPKSEAGQ